MKSKFILYLRGETICILTWSNRASFALYRWYRMMVLLLFRIVALADKLHVNYLPNWVYLSNQYAIISSYYSTFWQWTFQYHLLTLNLWNETKVKTKKLDKIKMRRRNCLFLTSVPSACGPQSVGAFMEFSILIEYKRLPIQPTSVDFSAASVLIFQTQHNK